MGFISKKVPTMRGSKAPSQPKKANNPRNPQSYREHSYMDDNMSDVQAMGTTISSEEYESKRQSWLYVLDRPPGPNGVKLSLSRPTTSATISMSTSSTLSSLSNPGCFDHTNSPQPQPSASQQQIPANRRRNQSRSPPKSRGKSPGPPPPRRPRSRSADHRPRARSADQLAALAQDFFNEPEHQHQGHYDDQEHYDDYQPAPSHSPPAAQRAPPPPVASSRNRPRSKSPAPLPRRGRSRSADCRRPPRSRSADILASMDEFYGDDHYEERNNMHDNQHHHAVRHSSMEDYHGSNEPSPNQMLVLTNHPSQRAPYDYERKNSYNDRPTAPNNSQPPGYNNQQPQPQVRRAPAPRSASRGRQAVNKNKYLQAYNDAFQAEMDGYQNRGGQQQQQHQQQVESSYHRESTHRHSYSDPHAQQQQQPRGRMQHRSLAYDQQSVSQQQSSSNHSAKNQLEKAKRLLAQPRPRSRSRPRGVPPPPPPPCAAAVEEQPQYPPTRQQQPQQLHQQQPPPEVPTNTCVAINSKGQCVRHPYIQLQRFSHQTGTMKTMLDSCPVCDAMDNESVASSAI